ncbi:unnamed protein product [Prorocentrum cordatum]|uniref:Uncharacterized protein n=1 Tax=Prorocentrum cordatum TaxID=2364126 RepID=A0ABN9SXE7_9DINO|nr:unnamed protein product [Polarella glacialis]
MCIFKNFTSAVKGFDPTVDARSQFSTASHDVSFDCKLVAGGSATSLQCEHIYVVFSILEMGGAHAAEFFSEHLTCDTRCGLYIESGDVCTAMINHAMQDWRARHGVTSHSQDHTGIAALRCRAVTNYS